MRLTRTLKGAKMKKIILKGAWLRMSSLISELWNDSLDPSCYFGRNNNEIKQIEDLMEKNYNSLFKNLNSEEQEILKKYNEQVIDYSIAVSEQAFNDGFSIGIRLISEAFYNVDL